MNLTNENALDLPHKIGDRGYCRDSDGGRRGFTIADEIVFKQSSYLDKCFSVQLLKFDNKDTKHPDEIRIGYYIKGKKAARKSKWIWGRFCPFFPPEDLRYLVAELKKRRWI
jgi:hypothetical protein